MVQIQNQIRIVTRSRLLNIFLLSFFRIPSSLFQKIITEKQYLRSVDPVIGGCKQHQVEKKHFKKVKSQEKWLHSDSGAIRIRKSQIKIQIRTTGFNICMRKLTALGSGSETLVFGFFRGILEIGDPDLKQCFLGLFEEPQRSGIRI